MPLYEYRCSDCSTTFEMRRAFSKASDPASCPRCASRRTRKVFGTIALIGAEGQTATEAAALNRNGGVCGCGAGGCGCHS